MNLKRDDQQEVLKISGEFINFYYENLNNKNFELINKYLRDYTIFSSQNIRYNGEKINEYFNYLKLINIKYYNINFDALHSGSRRINLLITGNIIYLENSLEVNKSFTEYIQFGTDSDKQFCIVISMFKIL